MEVYWLLLFQNYDIRFDAVTVTSEDFNAQLQPLQRTVPALQQTGLPLSAMFRKARADGNRYLLIAKGAGGYSDYIKVKHMPLFNKRAL